MSKVPFSIFESCNKSIRKNVSIGIVIQYFTESKSSLHIIIKSEVNEYTHRPSGKENNIQSGRLYLKGYKKSLIKLVIPEIEISSNHVNKISDLLLKAMYINPPNIRGNITLNNINLTFFNTLLYRCYKYFYGILQSFTMILMTCIPRIHATFS